MATLIWSTLANGTYEFDPDEDVLVFDDPGISAASVDVSSSSSTEDVIFEHNGRNVTLLMSPDSVTTSNVTFADGSRLVIGDNTTGTTGDDGDNVLAGGGADDRLLGGGGNDIFNGGGGNDVFQITHDYGPTFRYGNDELNGGDGFDSMFYTVTNGWAVNVNLATGVATGGDGEGSVFQLSSIEGVTGTMFDDTLTGSDDGNHLHGGAGDDTIGGGAGDDTIGGGAGNDSITGGAGDDSMSGGAGVDTAFFSGNRADYGVVVNGLEVEVADSTGRDGTDTLTGIERLQFADQVLIINTWEPTPPTTYYWSELSSGSLAFDPDRDVLVFDVPGLSAADFPPAAHSRVGTTFSYQGKTVFLETGADTITPTNVTFMNESRFLWGDLTTGTVGDGAGSTINGSAEGDYIAGWRGDDTISAGAGDDFILVDHLDGNFDATYGNDVIDGGAGFDHLYYYDALYGIAVNLAAGTATGGDREIDSTDPHPFPDNAPPSVFTLRGIEWITATFHADTLVGSAADEFFQGRNRNDVIDGGAGTDTSIYSGGRADYRVTARDDGSVTVEDLRPDGGAIDGVDTLTRIERLQFADGVVELSSGPGSATTYNWSELSSGSIMFDPDRDVLFFDDPGISAASVDVSSSSSTEDVIFEHNGRNVALLMSPDSVTTSNVTFADGSRLLIGDNTTGTTGDDGDNVLAGGGADDRLLGGGGNDILNGGGGNDVFQITHDYGPTFRYGNDELNGGDGFDSMFYTVTNGWAVNVNLATGVATGGDGEGSVLQLSSIEGVTGTMFDDTLTGSDDGNHLHGGAGDDTIAGGAGVDHITGGAGNDTLYGGDSLNGNMEVDTAYFSGNHADYEVVVTNGVVEVTDYVGSDGTDTLTGFERLQFADGSSVPSDWLIS